MLTVPPVLEPFTLAEAKLRAGLDWADGDPREPMLRSFITAARSQVERDTGVALLAQTHVISLARWGWSCAPVRLPWRPVQTVEIDGFDAGLFTLDPSSVEATPATLELARGVWPASLHATIVVGFDTLEELQQQAPGLYHAVGLLLAHYATVGRDLTIVGTIIDTTPMGYAEAIAPYQLVTLA